MEPISIELYKELVKIYESTRWILDSSNWFYGFNTFLFHKAIRRIKTLKIIQSKYQINGKHKNKNNRKRKNCSWKAQWQICNDGLYCSCWSLSNNRTNNSRFYLNNFFKISKKMTNSETNYWQNAERTNGRMAMMGFLALVINYGLFGWIIPGIF